MFLFTTPTPAQPTTPAAKPSPVTDAIRGAAERTGVSFDYLVRTAQRESNLDPTAKASTSSATGLFQFVEQTWLGLVKTDGEKAGLQNLSGSVQDAGSGRLTITDPKLKAQVLALREDPQTASTLAGVFTAHNRDTLTASLGREPSGGELYIAHFLGAGGASELVKLAAKSPDTPAASLFPEAAAANRSIFYDRAGAAKGAGDVYAQLTSTTATALTPADLPATPAVASATAPSAVPLVADTPGKPLYGLFRTNGGPVAETVRKAWLDLPGRKPAAAENGGGRVAFYPSSGGSAGSTQTASLAASPPSPLAAAGVPSDSAAPRAVDVPLPPERARAASARPATLQVPKGARAPLDLLAFTKVRG